MAEAQEGLWMSARERDRLKVLHEVRKRHITQKQAGVELGLSVRWVRTLLKRLRWRARSAFARLAVKTSYFSPFRLLTNELTYLFDSRSKAKKIVRRRSEISGVNCGS